MSGGGRGGVWLAAFIQLIIACVLAKLASWARSERPQWFVPRVESATHVTSEEDVAFLNNNASTDGGSDGEIDEYELTDYASPDKTTDDQAVVALMKDGSWPHKTAEDLALALMRDGAQHKLVSEA